MLEKTRTGRPHRAGARRPYLSGDRIRATDPEGLQYLGKVTSVQPTGDGDFTVVAEIREPRHLRGHLLTSVVDETGHGPGVEPYRR